MQNKWREALPFIAMKHCSTLIWQDPQLEAHLIKFKRGKSRESHSDKDLKRTVFLHIQINSSTNNNSCSNLVTWSFLHPIYIFFLLLLWRIIFHVINFVTIPFHWSSIYKTVLVFKSDRISLNWFSGVTISIGMKGSSTCILEANWMFGHTGLGTFHKNVKSCFRCAKESFTCEKGGLFLLPELSNSSIQEAFPVNCNEQVATVHMMDEAACLLMCVTYHGGQLDLQLIRECS